LSLVDVILLALALSIDAFAVSLAAAATGRIAGGRAIFRLSFHFGLFQFLMPIMGWLAGIRLEPLIASIDHWIAFFLLGFIGFRMIISAFSPERAESRADPSRGMKLMALSIATSIDALAVGLTLGLLHIDILWPSLTIGIITGSVCLFAILLGSRLHVKFGKHAEAIGGVVLIGIAIRILVAHLSA
jgi:manganese efflux pump family protein